MPVFVGKPYIQQEAMATNNEEDFTKLRLDRSRTARAFEKEESLWEAELNRMFELVHAHIKALDDALKPEKDTDLMDLPLLSIGLFGTYGSGKTSLLKTFADQVKRRREKNKNDAFFEATF